MPTEISPLSRPPNDANPGWQHRVSQAFSRAAPHYLERARAQAGMGEALWRRLPAEATCILDLGCGPGQWTARLARHYRRRVLGLDLAPGMLQQARYRHGGLGYWLCADAACLPLAEGGIDLLFSNLAIQWCRNPDRVFAEMYRVLTPDGRALINTLVPGTLMEVAYAWSRPGRPAAIEHFPSAQRICQAAQACGFEVMPEQVAERFYYPDIQAVMNSIKGVGAQLAHGGKMLTRRDLVRATHRYETLRQAAGLPVTYQRLTLELHKPRRPRCNATS